MLLIQIDLTPAGLWNLYQILLLFLFLAMGIFFILKYCRENQKELKSLNQINIGYAIFFIASGLNQFVYIIALVPNFWPAVDEFIGQTSITLFFGSKSSISIA